jgi:hypothetical protein
MYLNKHRTNSNSSAQTPPTYTGGQQNIPLEQKYDHNSQPEAQPSYQQPQQHQQPYPAQPQGQYMQQPMYNEQQQYAPYPQDPVHRGQTVSPVSSVGYNAPPQSDFTTPQQNYSAPANASELSTPQHTGPYNPNVSELSTQK